MNIMLNIFNNNLIIFIFLLVILAAIVLGFLDTRRLKKRLKIFFNGSKAQDLEELLASELKKVRKLEDGLKKLGEDHKITRGLAVKSVHKVGIIRFNPFKDMGGDQSFVIVLLDAKNNGVILTSLFTREGSRVYAKPVIGGKSKYDLTEEENEALEKAMNNTNPKS